MTRTALQHAHNLSVSGGTEATTYFGSANYLDQPGLVRSSGIDRLTGRLNVNHDAFDNRLSVGLQLRGSHLKRDHQDGVLKSMIEFNPTLPVRDPDTGEYTEFTRFIGNPVAQAERITDFTIQKRLSGDVSIEADILENLTASGRLGVEVGDGIRRTGVPGSGPPLWVGRGTGGSARQAERELSNIVPQATLTYDTADLFNGHDVRVLGGFEYRRETWQAVSAESESFVTDALLHNNLAAGASNQDVSSTKQLVEQISFFSRLNYNAYEKYLLTLTVRRDGSSVFGENNKFAWFPSVSVGWNLAQEGLMQGIDKLSQLKLRLSYGLTGNQGVPPLQSKSVLAPDAGFRGVFGEGETTVTGVAQRRAPSPNLKWEETEEINVGVDLVFGRFDGSVNWYRKDTDDLLLDVPVPPPGPSPSRLANVGSVVNTGVEASLRATVFQRENLMLSLDGNISSNYNEVKELGGRDFIDHTGVAAQTAVFAQRLAVGHPIGAYHGPVFAGINEQGLETFKDGEGGTTSEIGEAPKKFIGNPIPDFSYGFGVNFQYGNFDVSTFLRGEQNREIFTNTEQELNTKSNIGQGLNVFEKTLTDGTSVGHVPKYSSRWVKDASFFRMDDVTIGYSIPSTDAYGLRRLRIYGTVQNVFIITPYEGYDPELNKNVTGRGLGFRSLARPDRGVEDKSYPFPRTFTLGVDLTF
jgi:iron complex outermembrane receptor protein